MAADIERSIGAGVKKFVILSLVVGLAGIGVGIGRRHGGTDETAQLRAEVAALRGQVTATSSAPATPSTAAPTTTTTTTAPPATTTTTMKVVTTTRPPLTTTTTVKPWCSARALTSPVTKGMTETILITSNLPTRAAWIRGQSVTTDPGGNGTVSFAAPGGQLTATMGQILPKTNNVKVAFYAQAPTLEQLLDGPLPPVLASCTTSYVSVGP